ncbi:hypothetical protein AB0J90_06380 [Micromonospora sp. NPDC049523]|uniref:hypothetical protein n=1 Tax=Micromonospora sp. NPDC049523 TaxID=3155921 RepID=UPI003442BEFF
MRVVRTIAGVLLLTVGLAALLVGSALWTVAAQRDAGGAFTATLQRIQTPGRAIVVPDLDALLRRDAPFTRTGQARLRITAGTESRPAFLGLAPTADVGRYLATMPYALVDRVAVTRGRLPVQVTGVSGIGVPSQALVSTPGEQAFWVRQAASTLDLDADDLRGQRLSLVVMYPDAAPGVALDLRAELRVGWLEPTTWGLLAGGALLGLLAVAVLVWPSRPREVVFVVEPSQLPVLTARLGVRALDSVGQPVQGGKQSRRAARSQPQPQPQPQPLPSQSPSPVAPAAAPAGWPLHSNLPAPSRPVDTTSPRSPNGLPARATENGLPTRATENGLPGRATDPVSARPETLADVLSQPESTQGSPAESTQGSPVESTQGSAPESTRSGPTAPPVEVAANGGPAGGAQASGRSLDHIWPASSPPPAKLVLNWPPRAAGTTGPLSKQPANTAPAYPAKTSPVRSAQFQPTLADAAQPEAVKPEAVKPEAVKPETAESGAVQPEAVASEADRSATAEVGTARPGAVPPAQADPQTKPVGTAQTRPDPAPKSEPALDPVHVRAERVTNPVPAYPGKGMAESQAAQASGVPVVGGGPAAKPAASRATATRRTKAGGTAESGAVTTRSKKCKPVPETGAQPSATGNADADSGSAATAVVGGGGSADTAEATSTR